jgi:hypothetical protein
VRTNDAELSARVRGLLQGHLVSSQEAPPNLSLYVGSDAGATHELHRLYRGDEVAVHTRSIGRLVRAVLAHLDGFIEPPASTIRLRTRVLVREGTAILLDAMLGMLMDRIERRLDRDGFQVADLPGAAIDRETLELVLWRPRLELSSPELATFDDDYPRERRELPIEDGRVQIAAIVMPPRSHDDADVTSPARRLVDLAHLAMTADGKVRAHDLVALAHLEQKGLVTHLAEWDDRQLLDFLTGLA